jgi:hypothetical protein
MSISINYRGRLCNNIIQYLVGQYLSNKFDMKFDSDINLEPSFNVIKTSGSKTFLNQKIVDDSNILDYLNLETLSSNLLLNGFFQKKEIFLNKHFLNFCKNSIIPKKIENKPDLFVHVRLGDVEQHSMNLPFEYYKNQIDKISYNTMTISTDNPSSNIIKNLQQLYKNTHIFECTNPIEAVHYGACSNKLIIGSGSFGFCMALFAESTTDIYCIDHNSISSYFNSTIWDGDMIEAFKDRPKTHFYTQNL